MRSGKLLAESDTRLVPNWGPQATDSIWSVAMIEQLLISLTVFVLAMFVGYSVITKVPPTLHTPLMSGSNAISGIVIVGALVVAVREGGTVGIVLGLLSVILATINVVGGYLVTDRMLRMFRRSDEDRR